MVVVSIQRRWVTVHRDSSNNATEISLHELFNKVATGKVRLGDSLTPKRFARVPQSVQSKRRDLEA